MDTTDFEALLDLIDRKIEQGTPTAAEYWLGFYQGVRVSLQPAPEAPACDHSLLRDIVDMESPDPYLDAYARGYRDGCTGRMSPGY